MKPRTPNPNSKSWYVVVFLESGCRGLGVCVAEFWGTGMRTLGFTIILQNLGLASRGFPDFCNLSALSRELGVHFGGSHQKHHGVRSDYCGGYTRPSALNRHPRSSTFNPSSSSLKPKNIEPYNLLNHGPCSLHWTCCYSSSPGEAQSTRTQPL